MDVGIALNVLGVSEDAMPEELQAERLRNAGLTLRDEVYRLRRDLQRAETRARTMSALGAGVAGSPLIEGRSAGGPRHYLNDRPVHAGDSLYLLTHWGWLPGRYEWGYRTGSPGSFHFGLGGVAQEASSQILSGALLAWPDEIERGRR